MGIITKDTDYAMRALAYVTRHRKRTVAVREVSERLGISYSFLRTLMRKMSGAGLLFSAKGRNGGFTLGRTPRKIFMSDLIALFQGKADLTHCSHKQGPCPNMRTCLLHRRLTAMEHIFKREIAALSIDAIAKASAWDEGK